ncbi:MAG TPA: hypothetical protein VM577_08320 [Anaerovoracaceae bacterium]|nr:hypothetical protein [Anaerovoracaceae bacterium]
MACKINVAEQTLTIDLFVGGHRLKLTGPETVYVEALSSQGEWKPCQFPPWKFIIDGLTLHLANGRTLSDIDMGWG